MMYRGHAIPRATEIHHCNRRHGKRLIDERWFISTSCGAHEDIEANPTKARANGFLLPINADADSRSAGVVALTTPELMAAKVRR